MADIFTKEKRSEVMSSVKGKGSRLEKRVARLLRTNKIRYRSHPKNLPGNPDFYLPEFSTVVFVDSCFWHGCKYHGSHPKTNAKFWERKIERNKERDCEINKAYKQTNHKVLRVWEHQVKNWVTNKKRNPFERLGDKI